MSISFLYNLIFFNLEHKILLHTKKLWPLFVLFNDFSVNPNCLIFYCNSSCFVCFLFMQISYPFTLNLSELFPVMSTQDKKLTFRYCFDPIHVFTFQQRVTYSHLFHVLGFTVLISFYSSYFKLLSSFLFYHDCYV